jgi:hypothetical protein
VVSFVVMRDDDDYPFSAWDDLKFTVMGFLMLLSPLFFVGMLGLLIWSLL